MSDEPRGINRRTVFTVTKSLADRLKAGTDQTPTERGCWTWTGAMRNGYGAIKQDGKVLSTHVVAWVIANGQQVPEGCKITHDCDNRICCNPAHLQAGTAQSNVREMYSRRNVRVARGELAPNAMLTDELAARIMAMHVVYGYGAKRISALLELAYYPVRGVVRGTNWKHVPVPTKEQACALLGITEPPPALPPRPERAPRPHRNRDWALRLLAS